GGAGFQGKTMLRVGVKRPIGVEHFDGDVAFQTGVAGTVHLAHSSGAQKRHYPVRPQIAARVQSHKLSLSAGDSPARYSEPDFWSLHPATVQAPVPPTSAKST